MNSTKSTVASFSVKDICRIIEISAHSGVAVLKFGDIEITFRENGPSDIVDQPKAPFQESSPQASGEQEPQAQVLSPIQEELLEESYESQLLFDDPMAYEQMIIDGFSSGRNGPIEDVKAPNN